MADFLSEVWVAERQRRLDDAGPVPLEGADVVHVVIEMYDAPNSVPRALTLTLGVEGARLDVGDHPGADALVRLSYLDATSLHAGQFDSATALREGRIKVRGDFSLVVGALAWLQRAHALG